MLLLTPYVFVEADEVWTAVTVVLWNVLAGRMRGKRGGFEVKPGGGGGLVSSSSSGAFDRRGELERKT
jgi:hypothetical protein